MKEQKQDKITQYAAGIPFFLESDAANVHNTALLVIFYARSRGLNHPKKARERNNIFLPKNRLPFLVTACTSAIPKLISNIDMLWPRLARASTKSGLKPLSIETFSQCPKQR